MVKKSLKHSKDKKKEGSNVQRIIETNFFDNRD